MSTAAMMLSPPELNDEPLPAASISDLLRFGPLPRLSASDLAPSEKRPSPPPLARKRSVRNLVVGSARSTFGVFLMSWRSARLEPPPSMLRLPPKLLGGPLPSPFHGPMWMVSSGSPSFGPTSGSQPGD